MVSGTSTSDTSYIYKRDNSVYKVTYTDSGTTSYDICRYKQTYDYLDTTGGIRNFYPRTTNVCASDKYQLYKDELELYFKNLKRISDIKSNNKKLSRYYSKNHMLDFDQYRNIKMVLYFNKLRQPPRYTRIMDKLKKINKHRKKYKLFT